ncbi:EAL domain-containing protein [Phytobacter diazotrophicus]|uniref:cyclic-guanylate-specific phosphodiesterase n=1 Tax=Phytobacter diazotrophicus TaxID=395631 RepID=A0ABN6LUB1_9ENTR|nr:MULTISPECIES: EAL domain-containing protein [Phytobacter]MDU4150615.1 EAL domain-containing protein [Enterobacteriaceae bacterium]PTA97578.1 EAL domain-containing protein [Kluyvera sp. Nf5]PWF51851.1 EAL domain-containing protein [[Kluyvera] intestini]PXW52354.1 sensor c-di-GMP phosphodiesterase-like protein [Grimontella sp. AG753]QIH64862.1 EAL domain-containing protein [Enterobacteriaceae bacterium A-F18]
MTNRRLVSLITGVLLFAVLLPVALSVWLAHRQAEESFMNELNTFSALVKMRADRVVSQGKTALRQLETYDGISCSQDHLLAMRRISYTFRYVQEVIYLEGTIPLCSSLERNSSSAPFPAPQRVTKDGFRAWLTSHNDLGLTRAMVGLGTRRYIVITDPLSFIDVLSYGPWPINIALVGTNSGRVIASNRTLDPEMLKQIDLTTPTQRLIGGEAWNTLQVPELGVTIITWASLTPLKESWHRLLVIWVPVGLLLSLVLAFFLLRMLRRLQSPQHRMQDAIRAREIEMFYQPIVTLADGKIVGAEALARWRQSDGSYLAPDTFIPLAEQTGLMPQLTKVIIEKVFEDMGPWLQKNPDLHVSINLEPSDLLTLTLPAQLQQRVNDWQISPSQIALEVTEHGFADPTTCMPTITALRAAGHAIYIDDFGTGYSSLSYLQNLDVDIIKIDKSFVDALEYKNMTTHIIEMAKALKLAMVAEGIETEGQLKWLSEHGVQYGQGWLYSKALPKDAFLCWAESNRNIS